MKPLSQFPTHIKTQRLNLRVIDATKENAEKLIKIIDENREYLEAWQGHFEYLKNTDDVLAYLNKRANQISTGDGVCFYIFLGDEIIGRIRFFHIHGLECEIGYWLIKDANGNGFMSEALTALEKELFQFGFNKIILDIDDGNTNSISLAERNGYKMEKRLPMESWAKCVGKCDSLIFAKSKK